jgi:hypothetical protein
MRVPETPRPRFHLPSDRSAVRRRARTGGPVAGLVALALLLGATPALDSARADDGTVILGREIQKCWDLRFDGQYEASYRALKSLWEDNQGHISRADRIQALELFGELYCIWQQWDDAEECYERVLSLDLNWTPRSLWNLPASHRVPIIKAFRKRFGDGRSPGLSNLALLDVIVVDLHSEPKATALKPALPRIINDRIQHNLDAYQMQCDGVPVRIVPRETRQLMLQEIRDQNRLAGAEVTTQNVDRSTIVAAGRHLAVQGFVEATLVRTGRDELKVTIGLVSVETAAIVASESALGKFDDLFSVIDEAVDKWAARVAHELANWNGDRREERSPGPARSYEALLHYAEALGHIEKEEYVLAESSLRACLDVDSDYDEARETWEELHRMEGVAQFTPPASGLEMISLASSSEDEEVELNSVEKDDDAAVYAAAGSSE